eukprot:8547641-Pyramimonas_sp.AAC.1
MAFDAGVAPHLLVGDLHGALVRCLSDVRAKHFQGLSQAARDLHRQNRIPSKVKNQLLRLDWAHNIVRHITATSAREFYCDVRADLLGGVSQGQMHDAGFEHDKELLGGGAPDAVCAPEAFCADLHAEAGKELLGG